MTCHKDLCHGLRHMGSPRAEKAADLIEAQAKQIAELEAKVAATEKATRFAGLVLDAHRNDGYPCDIDGDVLQDFALEAGMIEERTVEGPCREGCSCSEMTESHEWPITCLFNTEAGKAAIASSKEQS